MSETKVADRAGTAAREARIDKILQGAVDPHVHSGPSIAPRAIDHLDLVRELSEAGFAAVLTKDHDYAGVATPHLITKHHPASIPMRPSTPRRWAGKPYGCRRSLPKIICAGKRTPASPIPPRPRRCVTPPPCRCWTPTDKGWIWS